MAAIQWLEARVPGFRDLPRADRDALSQFLLLWSYFEASVLATKGSAKAIEKQVRQCELEGRLRPEQFRTSLEYFRARYFPGGAESGHFHHLNLRPSDNPELVRRVLGGGSDAPRDTVMAVLIVVLRFRNNLFHGLKWAYEFRAQRDNFEHANSILMQATEQLSRHVA